MKRHLAFLLAVLLVLPTVPLALAEADTRVTNVSMTVEEGYKIVIPQSLSFGNYTSNEEAVANMSIEVTNYLLDDGRCIEVQIESDNGMYLISENGYQSLEYKLYNLGTLINEDNMLLEFTSAGKEEIVAKLADYEKEPEYTGKYTDILRFTISIIES